MGLVDQCALANQMSSLVLQTSHCTQMSRHTCAFTTWRGLFATLIKRDTVEEMHQNREGRHAILFLSVLIEHVGVRSYGRRMVNLIGQICTCMQALPLKKSSPVS